MNQTTLLYTDQISYSYGTGNHALNQVSLEIRRGEKIAVLGANGAGKSTFFLCLNGVITPDQGEIWLKGKKIDKKNCNELRRHVGIVFQDAESQIIAPTVFREVSFGPVNLKLSREEVKKRTEEALEYMNLLDFKDRPPHYLSGGEKKRVTIADIIAMEPELIVFDEPSAALDPVSQDMLEQVLEQLACGGKTLLLSTHDVDFAYRFADRILIFRKGSMIADGAPVQIFKNEEVLKSSNLKKPVLLEIRDMLVEKGLLSGDSGYPKSMQMLKELL